MKFLGIKLSSERFGILNCVENTINKSETYVTGWKKTGTTPQQRLYVMRDMS